MRRSAKKGEGLQKKENIKREKEERVLPILRKGKRGERLETIHIATGGAKREKNGKHTIWRPVWGGGRKRGEENRHPSQGAGAQSLARGGGKKKNDIKKVTTRPEKKKYRTQG